MNDRAQVLLRTLVERYIRDGQPVGSRSLARDSHLDLSPATVRNVMSDLEEMGLVTAPHTSAGRIPTAKGYRIFVDTLLTVRPLQKKIIQKLQHELDLAANTTDLLGSASSMLSAVSQMAGVVMLPRHGTVMLRQVEFLPLSGNRVLVIIVTNRQEVQNRIIHTARTYSPSELDQAANFLNQEFAGRDLMEVRASVLASMREAREDMNRIMSTAIQMADQVFSASETDDYILAGQNNLFAYQEMADIDKLRQLFEAFNRKRDILHLLDQSIGASGVQIFIGDESGYGVLEDCSVVTAPYKVEDRIVGVLGVIGPTRMAYDRVIPIVDVTAKLLGSALTAE
ncbi:MAG: heat-inducible transcriptional repressor HrcA [Pseudomonadota bacterium]|nr:MAG: heat-inducible transcriptional repressor HrcA [Pseudomonadota bacterium]